MCFCAAQPVVRLMATHGDRSGTCSVTHGDPSSEFLIPRFLNSNGVVSESERLLTFCVQIGKNGRDKVPAYT